MKKILRVVLILLLFLIGTRSLSFSQESEYQPLVSGMEEYKARNYQKALENFLKAEKTFSDDADVHFYLGLTYLQLNQKEKAIEYFKKAIKINPNYLDAHFQLEMVLIQEKKFPVAVSHRELRIFLGLCLF